MEGPFGSRRFGEQLHQHQQQVPFGGQLNDFGGRGGGAPYLSGRSGNNSLQGLNLRQCPVGLTALPQIFCKEPPRHGGNTGGNLDSRHNNMMMSREDGRVLQHQQPHPFQEKWRSPSKMRIAEASGQQQLLPLGGGFGSQGSSSGGSSSMGSDSRSSEENIEETEAILFHISRSLPHKGVRLTLKVEVSYTDHSHLIGCRGLTIRKVMRDTGCHIHFPDSNKGSKDFKSNQVTIAGNTLADVERARSRIRDLSPLIFHFNLPMICNANYMNTDQYHVFMDNIQTTYRVQVTLQSPNKYQSTTSLTVKGCEIDAPAVIEAATKILDYFCAVSGTARMNAVIVETTMDITPAQHHFVRSFNDTNVKKIARNTGAIIIFPDLSDLSLPTLKKSRVLIRGEINCVYYARQQILGSLPIKLVFEIPDDYILNTDEVKRINNDLSVTVKVCKNISNRNMEMSEMNPVGGGDFWIPRLGLGNPMQQASPTKSAFSSNTDANPGYLRAIHLMTSERNASNIYDAKQRVLGGRKEPLVNANIPQTYQIRPVSSAFFAPETLYNPEGIDQKLLSFPSSVSVSSMTLPPPPGFQTPPQSPAVSEQSLVNSVGNNAFQWRSPARNECNTSQLIQYLRDNLESQMSCN